MTPIRSMLVLLFLVTCMLLAAGCAGKTPENARRADIWIPVDGKNLPVITTPVIPQDKYVFVEHRIHTSGNNISAGCSCGGPSIDFANYYFTREKGALYVYSRNTSNESLKMFYGDEVSLSGCAGEGINSYAFPVYSLPYIPSYRTTGKKVIIESISGDGTVSLLYDQEKITLKPEETWYNNTTRIENRNDWWYNRQGQMVWSNCSTELVTTDSFHNAGILDKSALGFERYYDDYPLQVTRLN